MDIDFTDALRRANEAVIKADGHPFRTPETVILSGTWRGLTYDQMAEDSEYSKNYLMRDVAPKLWRQLSRVFGHSIGKTNFRVILERYVSENRTKRNSIKENAKHKTAHKAPHRATSTDSQSDSREISVSSVPSAEHSTIPSSHSTIPSSLLYGYKAELSQLKQRLVDTSSNHLIGIWGLAGVGKSLLCDAAVDAVKNNFDAVIWRSLESKPQLSSLCTAILTDLEPPREQPIDQLLSILNQRRILLVIEDADAILESQALAGDYQPAYLPYRAFFQSIASSQSSLLLTGTEAPADWVEPVDHHAKRFSIYLTGLDDTAATALLKNESLSAPQHWPDLIHRYQGHPFALQSVARVIRDMFTGEVEAFLQQDLVLLADIIRLLAPSFDRLCERELTILYWLASQSAPLSLAEIQKTLPSLVSATDLISALDSLKQRSYLYIQPETTPPKFQLPPLVKAYAAYQLMTQFKSHHKNDASVTRAATPLGVDQSVAKHVITLGKPIAQPVRLSQWLQGSFETHWHSLSQLFDVSKYPSTRLRSAYHLRDETFIKRYKSVSLGVLYKNAQPEHANLDHGKLKQQRFTRVLPEAAAASGHTVATGAVLVVAIRHKAGSLCEVCVQVQPEQGADTLPADLELRLLDAQKTLLATVQAQPSDSFIQLPFFQGQPAESFDIELAIGEFSHTEAFLI